MRSPIARVILAPRHKLCQCLRPILPHCDSFFIIVFPMSIVCTVAHVPGLSAIPTGPPRPLAQYIFDMDCGSRFGRFLCGALPGADFRRHSASQTSAAIRPVTRSRRYE